MTFLWLLRSDKVPCWKLLLNLASEIVNVPNLNITLCNYSCNFCRVMLSSLSKQFSVWLLSDYSLLMKNVIKERAQKKKSIFQQCLYSHFDKISYTSHLNIRVACMMWEYHVIFTTLWSNERVFFFQKDGLSAEQC